MYMSLQFGMQDFVKFVENLLWPHAHIHDMEIMNVATLFRNHRAFKKKNSQPKQYIYIKKHKFCDV